MTIGVLALVGVTPEREAALTAAGYAVREGKKYANRTDAVRAAADTVRAVLTNGRGVLSGDEMVLLPQLEIVCAARFGGDGNGAGSPVGEGVVGRVEEKIGEDLPVGTGIAVHDQPFRNFDRHADRGLFQHRPQAGDDLVGGFLQIELPPLGMRAVDRDLFERLDQIASAVQVCHQLRRRIP